MPDDPRDLGDRTFEPGRVGQREPADDEVERRVENFKDPDGNVLGLFETS